MNFFIYLTLLPVEHFESKDSCNYDFISVLLGVNLHISEIPSLELLTAFCMNACL
jgi:hypothetical protein